jgi:hypothetical protein
MTWIKKPIWLPVFSIIGFGLLITSPIIINGCVIGHDVEYHLIWTKYFSEQFFQGDLYPRWLQNMNAGLGSPAFFFYAPLPFFIASFLEPLTHYSASACNVLGVSSALAMIASGLTAYLWLAEIAPKPSALMASLLYMVWPYHVAVDLYQRFAFAEYWSFVWLPLILFFSIKIQRRSNSGIIGLAISIALLILTHLPTFLIFVLVPIGYALFLAEREQRKFVCIRLTIALILAVAFSAVYWLPAMTTQQNISMDTILTNGYFYANNFLFSDRTIGYGSPFLRYLEISTILTGALALCAWVVAARNVLGIRKRESLFFVLVATVSVWMMFPLSTYIWETFPVMQNIEFPWRFNSVLTIASIGLLVSVIEPIRKMPTLFRRAGKEIPLLYLIVFSIVPASLYLANLQTNVFYRGSQNPVLTLSIILIITFGGLFLFNKAGLQINRALSATIICTTIIFIGSGWFYKSIFIDRLSEESVAYVIRIGKRANGYQPRWVPQEEFQGTNLEALGDSFSQIRIDEGNASVVVDAWEPRKIVFRMNAVTSSRLTIHQFYYPGWTAVTQGQAMDFPVGVSQLGLMQIQIPAGQYTITLTLEPLWQEKVGMWISVGTGIILICLVLLNQLINLLAASRSQTEGQRKMNINKEDTRATEGN